jgi:hypothetical protein
MSPVATARETYEDFHVGDEVYCLAWVGMPFQIVGKDDETQKIALQGLGRTSLTDGAQVDIGPSNLFLITHQLWDQIWYWPDRKGETYTQVFDRFVAEHRTGEVVTAYFSEVLALLGMMVVKPANAVAYRIDVNHAVDRRTISAEPVAAYVESEQRLVTMCDPSIPDDRWLKCGPKMPVTIAMHGYRWSLGLGEIILNWQDFLD